MNPTRRGFLGLFSSAAALTLDPELALWVPGKKLISVPSTTVAVDHTMYCVDFSHFSSEHHTLTWVYETFMVPAMKQLESNVGYKLNQKYLRRRAMYDPATDQCHTRLSYSESPMFKHPTAQ